MKLYIYRGSKTEVLNDDLLQVIKITLRQSSAVKSVLFKTSKMQE